MSSPSPFSKGAMCAHQQEGRVWICRHMLRQAPLCCSTGICIDAVVPAARPQKGETSSTRRLTTRAVALRSARSGIMCR